MSKILLHEFKNQQTLNLGGRKRRFIHHLSPSFKVWQDGNIITHETKNGIINYLVPSYHGWRITGGNFEDVFENVNSKNFTYEIDTELDCDLKDNQESVDTLVDIDEIAATMGFVEKEKFKDIKVPEGKKIKYAEEILNFRRQDGKIVNKLRTIKGFDSSGKLVKVKSISRLGNKITIEFDKEVAIVDPQWVDQPAGGTDTLLFSDAPTTNYGTNVNLSLGFYTTTSRIGRTLIKFSGLVSGNVPDAVTVTAAIITLWPENVSGDMDECQVYCHQVAWVHNEATWNIYSTGNNWDTAGSFGNNDVYKATYDETTGLNWAGSNNIDCIDCVKKLVGVDKTWTNNGFLIKGTAAYESGDTNYVHTRSSDNGTAAERPKITVDFYTAIDASASASLNFIDTPGRNISNIQGSVSEGVNLDGPPSGQTIFNPVAITEGMNLDVSPPVNWNLGTAVPSGINVAGIVTAAINYLLTAEDKVNLTSLSSIVWGILVSATDRVNITSIPEVGFVIQGSASENLILSKSSIVEIAFLLLANEMLLVQDVTSLQTIFNPDIVEAVNLTGISDSICTFQVSISEVALIDDYIGAVRDLLGQLSDSFNISDLTSAYESGTVSFAFTIKDRRVKFEVTQKKTTFSDNITETT